MTGMRIRRQLLGISHIVAGVSSIDAAEAQLLKAGFSMAHRRDATINPEGKRSFSVGPLMQYHDIGLYEPAVAGPTIELVHPVGADQKLVPTSAVSILIGDTPIEDARSVNESFNTFNTVPELPGMFFHPNGRAGKPQAAVIHVDNLEASGHFWNIIGTDSVPVGDKITAIDIRGILAKGTMKIYMREDRTTPPDAHLDGNGIACCALLCADIGKVSEHYQKAGFEVSERITFKPFAHSLDIIFVRNKTREMYEFISLSRPSH